VLRTFKSIAKLVWLSGYRIKALRVRFKDLEGINDFNYILISSLMYFNDL